MTDPEPNLIGDLVQLARHNTVSALAASIYQQQLGDPELVAEVAIAALVALAREPDIALPHLVAALDRSAAHDNTTLDGQIRAYRAALADGVDPSRLADEMARVYLPFPSFAAVTAAAAVLRLARQG